MTTEQREIGSFEQFPGIQEVADEAMHSAITILKERPNAIEVAEENEEISNFPRLKSFFTGGGLKAKYYQTQQKFRSSVYSWRSDSLRQILPLMGLARLTDQPGIEAYFEAEITAGFEETSFFPELRDSKDWDQGIFAIDSLARVVEGEDIEFDYDIFGAESNLAELALLVRSEVGKDSPEMIQLEKRLAQSINREPDQHQRVYRYFVEALAGKRTVDRSSPNRRADESFKARIEIETMDGMDSLRESGITGQDAIKIAQKLIKELGAREATLLVSNGRIKSESEHKVLQLTARLIAFGASGSATDSEVMDAINKLFELTPVDTSSTNFPFTDTKKARSINIKKLSSYSAEINIETAGLLHNLAELAETIKPSIVKNPIDRFGGFAEALDGGSVSFARENYYLFLDYQRESDTRLGSVDSELEISDRNFKKLDSATRLQVFQALAIDGKTDDLLRLVDKLEPEDRAHGLFVIAMTQVIAGTGELINPDLSIDINKPEERNLNRQAVREGLGALARLLPGVEAEDFNGVAALRASERRLDIDAIIQRIKLATTEDGSDIAKDTAKLYEEIGSCSDLTAELKEELTNELTAKILEVETDQDLLVNEPLEVEETTEVEG